MVSSRSFFVQYVRTKVWLYLLIMAIVTVVFFVLDYASTNLPAMRESWLRNIPWGTFASTSLGTLLISIGFEFYLRDISEFRLGENLRKIQSDSNRRLVESIRAKVLLDPEAVKHCLSSEIADQMLLAILEEQTGDSLYAKEAFGTLAYQLRGYHRRAFDYRCRITFRPDDDSGNPSLYYQCFVELSYTGVLPAASFKFVEVSSVDEYNQLLLDSSYEVRAIRVPTLTYPKGDERGFNISYVRVNGQDLEVRPLDIDERLAFIASSHKIEELIGQTVRISYQYMTKVEKTSHVFMYSVTHPTRSLVIEFDYGSVDIGRVNVNDFFVSMRQPDVCWPTSQNVPQVIRVAVDDWIFPKSGVLLSWVLCSEMDNRVLSRRTDDS